jgi:hypothetical protein
MAERLLVAAGLYPIERPVYARATRGAPPFPNSRSGNDLLLAPGGTTVAWLSCNRAVQVAGPKGEDDHVT